MRCFQRKYGDKSGKRKKARNAALIITGVVSGFPSRDPVFSFEGRFDDHTYNEAELDKILGPVKFKF
jgi:hypothetical protein